MLIAKRGWVNENPYMPVILIDRKSRSEIGIADNKHCWVKNKEGVKILAIVSPQFKEYVGKGATVNHLLSAILHLTIGDEIQLEPLPSDAIVEAQRILRENAEEENDTGSN